LIDNSLENVVIFDGMRKQQIPLQNKFAMQLYLAFPAKEPAINSQQAIFYPFESSSDGFSFKLSTNLSIYGDFHPDNFFYFRTSEFDMDLFYNDDHLFSVRQFQPTLSVLFFLYSNRRFNLKCVNSLNLFLR
jgi:hypothetical protein